MFKELVGHSEEVLPRVQVLVRTHPRILAVLCGLGITGYALFLATQNPGAVYADNRYLVSLPHISVPGNTPSPEIKPVTSTPTPQAQNTVPGQVCQTFNRIIVCTIQQPIATVITNTQRIERPPYQSTSTTNTRNPMYPEPTPSGTPNPEHICPPGSTRLPSENGTIVCIGVEPAATPVANSVTNTRQVRIPPVATTTNSVIRNPNLP